MAEQLFGFFSVNLSVLAWLGAGIIIGVCGQVVLRRWGRWPWEATAESNEPLPVRSMAELQARMREQDHLATVGKLTSGVVHEINNPTGYVLSNLKTLRRYVLLVLQRETGELTEVERQELLFVQEDLPTLIDDCLDGVQRISGVVHSLRSFSRTTEAGEQASHTWAEMVATAVRLTHGEIHHQCLLTQDIQTQQTLLVNEREIVQVLANLILNARDAMELSGQGSHILVRATDVAGGTELCVEDDGPGIPPTIVKQIFEPFFTTKATDKGTGLGLSICREIIEQKHGGQLYYEPVPQGGARFVLRLPKAPLASE